MSEDYPAKLYGRYALVSKVLPPLLLFSLGGILSILLIETLNSFLLVGWFIGAIVILAIFYSPIFQLREIIKLQTGKSHQEIRKDFCGKENLFFKFYQPKIEDIREEEQKVIADFENGNRISFSSEDIENGVEVTSEEDGVSYSDYKVTFEQKDNQYEVEYIGDMSKGINLLQILIHGYVRGYYFKKLLEDNGYSLIESETKFLLS